jgi:hypothetical protein
VNKNAHEHGCELENNVLCNLAAKNGYLDCLHYLRVNGCPWDCWTVFYSCFKGHVDCLEYAIENGCPVHNGSLNVSVNLGYINCVECILQHRLLNWTSFATSKAVTKGFINILFLALEYDVDCITYNDVLMCLRQKQVDFTIEFKFNWYHARVRDLLQELYNHHVMKLPTYLFSQLQSLMNELELYQQFATFESKEYGCCKYVVKHILVPYL